MNRKQFLNTFNEYFQKQYAIPTESVLLNFVKLNNTSLGWIVFPS